MKRSKKLLAQLHHGTMTSRKETIYKFLQKKHTIVPCFVCSKHVRWKNATIEHIQPLSRGGTDDIDNLSISHFQCNQARGNDVDFSWNSNDNKRSENMQPIDPRLGKKVTIRDDEGANVNEGYFIGNGDVEDVEDVGGLVQCHDGQIKQIEWKRIEFIEFF